MVKSEDENTPVTS